MDPELAEQIIIVVHYVANVCVIIGVPGLAYAIYRAMRKRYAKATTQNMDTPPQDPSVVGSA